MTLYLGESSLTFPLASKSCICTLSLPMDDITGHEDPSEALELAMPEDWAAPGPLWSLHGKHFQSRLDSLPCFSWILHTLHSPPLEAGIPIENGSVALSPFSVPPKPRTPLKAFQKISFCTLPAIVLKFGLFCGGFLAFDHYRHVPHGAHWMEELQNVLEGLLIFSSSFTAVL